MVVCFTGGGTLGHIYPALAVHEALLGDRAYSAFWIGREHESERSAVEGAGLAFFPIASGKFRRYRSWKNVTDIARIIQGFFQALSLLHKKKPDVLFSKGGFVSVPPVFAAKVLGIRVITHESDATLGLATKLNSICSSVVCVPFAGSEGALSPKKVVVTGNPIRKELFEDEDISQFGIPEYMPLLLVLGGSQGSQQINALVRESLERLCSLCFIIHQCGSGDYLPLERENYYALPFLGKELGSLYRRSTLVVSRGGANTIAELLTFGCASLIIPLSGSVSRGDQVANAERLVALGAASALLGEVNQKNFLLRVEELLEKEEKRGILKANAKKLATIGSAEKLASLIRNKE